MNNRKIKGWVDGILTTRKPEEIASATLFTQDLYDGSVPATLIIGEDLSPKEGERALTVEQIDDRTISVKEAWPYLQHKDGCRTKSFANSMMSHAPISQRTCTCGLDNLRSSLIDKLGDGQ